MKIKRLHTTTYIDLFFCVVLLPAIIMLVPVDKLIIHNTGFAVTQILYLYALYFVYRKARIPALFMQRKFLRIFLLMAALVGTTALFAYYPMTEAPDAKLPTDFRQHLQAQTVWFFFLVVSGFSLAIELTIELFRQMLAKQEIEAEKNRAELALYKAQINPHFLFNTLNALYGLVVTKSENTESAFVKFSNILKYMYNTSADTIDLSSEIEYIRQYVDLQKLRLNHHTQVLFESHTDDDRLQIPPMLLITFIENAFKYGVSSVEECSIRIHINAERGRLLFETENDIRNKPTKNSTAVGLLNCRKRLELLYPDRFTLSIDEDKERKKFRVRLTIQLQ